MEDKVLITLRLMTWERAKGELEAYLQTYWHNDEKGKKKYEKADEMIHNFIKDFEETCC